MGTIFLENFKYGMDRRRPRASGIPGTLWTGKNVVLTRGGDIERAKDFVATYTLPAGQTFGLAEVRGQLWTFGSVAVPSPAVPLGVNYMQLSAPSGAAMTRVLDARAAGGKLYVIAQYADGNIFHFYNGSRVTDWDGVADLGFTYAILADWLAGLVNADVDVSASSVNNQLYMTARVPGTAFTVTQSTTDNGGTNDQGITLATPQVNVPAVAAVVASTAVTLLSGTTGKITGITINGLQLLAVSVPFHTSLTQTAADLAVKINDNYTTPNYSAVAVGQIVTISAAVGTGTTPNGYVVTNTTSGNIVLSAPNLSGGVAAVAGVAQVTTATLIGTPQSADLFALTINGRVYQSTGRASATGTSAFIASKRVFSTAGSLIQWDHLNDPTNWVATDPDFGHANGGGFINVANDAEGSERLVGAGRYLFNQLAGFTRRNTRLYNLSADATLIGLVQPVDNTGTIAARSIIGLGGIDVVYLADSGIRSLRPRDTTNAAFVEDLGTAIDPFVRAHIDTLSSDVYGRAVAVIQPRDDRLWLALDNRIYVLSYFPNSQISGWTYLEPGFSVTDFARVYDKLYARAGDTVYLYGGPTGNSYPSGVSPPPFIQTPFISQTPPARFQIQGYDQSGQGDWLVSAIIDPNNESTSSSDVGVLSDITYNFDDIGSLGMSPFIALDITGTAGGYMSISNMAVYDTSEPNAK